ncbi:MAG: hypothetical protein HY909_31360 [Deltaproteobacteria bacterium]|nr:hypothetical protein [Deltaproteobacteria bacterium]
MVKVKGSTLPRVRTEARALDRVAHSVLAEALGAEATELRPREPQGPVALLALRQEFASRPRPSPGSPDPAQPLPREIPVSEADWALLCALSEAMEGGDPRLTPGQLASSLLRERLAELRDEVERDGGAAFRALSHER